MKLFARMGTVVLLAAVAGPVLAAVSVTRLEGFNKTWQFINTDPYYKDIEYPNGYYKDYNGDGLPDYLICLQADNGSMRLFTINSAATGGDKTYANKTAGRDFAAAAGSFVPHEVFTPRAPKADTPDLVVTAKNTGGANGYESTNFTFYRLNKANTAWPTEKQQTFTMPFKATWVVQWPEYSFDNDDYPDFFIYNAIAPTSNRRFVLRLYSGQTWSLIWERTLNVDSGDTPPIYPGMPSSSQMIANPIPLLPVSRVGNGDFNDDGKPEFLLYYTYSKFDIGEEGMDMSYNTMINILNGASGAPLAPYSSAWTRVGPLNAAVPLLSSYTSDYDQDGYRDMVLTNPTPEVASTVPVFQGYSLKQRRVLFTSTNSDFGSGYGDGSSFRTIEAMDFGKYKNIDLTGDGKRDLHVFRDKTELMDDMGTTYNVPVKIGLFHTVAGGRKVWLSGAATFANFDRAHMAANDFNYDNILDFVLFKNPTSPGNPTWTIGNTAVTGTAISLGKQFNYTSSATGVLGLDQEFYANSAAAGNFGDMDGNSQRDTWASMMWEIMDSGDSQKGGGSLVIYNTPPSSSSSPAARFAALDILTTNQDVPFLMPTYARNLNEYGYVDNDKDGISDDVTVFGSCAVFALNFKAKGIYPAAGQVATPTPAHGGTYYIGRPLRWEPVDGTYACNAYDVYLGTSQTAVTNATRTSAEFRGNLAAPMYLPRPALTANTTYYWRVDTINPWGKVTKGAVWRLGAKPAVSTNAVGSWEAFR